MMVRKIWKAALVFVAVATIGLHGFAQAPAAGEPVPRTADGKPDLSGVWKTATSTAGPLALTAWGAERYNYNKVPTGDFGRPELDPLMHCYRPGLARLGPPLQVPKKSIRVRIEGESVPFPQGPSEFDVIEIRNAPRKVWVLYQFNNETRQIFTDKQTHPALDEDDLGTRWFNGHSVGKWDGDVFVIDTVNFRNEAWLTNKGHEFRNLHVVERLRRVDADTLEWERTMTDPIALARPYTTKATLKLRTDPTFTENVVCDQYYVRKVGMGFGGLLGINEHPWQLPEENPNADWQDVEKSVGKEGTEEFRDPRERGTPIPNREKP